MALQAKMQQGRASAARCRSLRAGGRTRTVLVAASASPFPKKDARLVLEDGSVWKATSFGAKGTQIGEVWFVACAFGSLLCVMAMLFCVQQGFFTCRLLAVLV